MSRGKAVDNPTARARRETCPQLVLAAAGRLSTDWCGDKVHLNQIVVDVTTSFLKLQHHQRLYLSHS
jgi:hypothetical protein